MMHKKWKGVQREKTDKALLKKFRRYEKVREEIPAQAEWITLSPPIRNGWQRTFVLREEFKHVKDFHIYKEVLEACNHIQFSKRKDFFHWNYKLKRKTEMSFELSHLHTWNFERANLSEKAKKCFIKQLVLREWGPAYYVYVPNIPKYLLKVKITPHYIYQRRIPNPNLESEYDELAYEFSRTDAWHKIGKLKGWNLHTERDWEYSKLFAKDKMLKKDFDDLKKEIEI